MGFFEFVFGKGAPKDDSQPKQAYYLSDDDAKTFGNIEYMRSSKTVKRTFAKKKGQTEHMESVRQISATTSSSVEDNGSTFSSLTPSVASSNGTSASTPASEPQSSTPRRAPRSNDMDLFRNMAKNIRK